MLQSWAQLAAGILVACAAWRWLWRATAHWPLLRDGRASDALRLAIEAAGGAGSRLEPAEALDGVLRRALEAARAERASVSRAPGDRVVAACERAAAGPVRSGRDTEHAVACPLRLGEELVGVLRLSRRRAPFSDADLLALQPFGTLAALLLRNCGLVAEARQVGQAKSAFLNLAAHELRTPLAVIRGYLSMLEDGTYEVPARTRAEAVDILVVKAQELEALVESVLTTARLEVGRVPRAPARLDAAEAVRQALARIAPRARLEGATVRACLPDGEVPVRADRGHVARILDSLLDNALTYSRPPADVVVAVRREAAAAVEVVVRDRGPGIPAEQHDRVFERFYRLDGGAPRFSPGLGLGLSIGRELALINEGSLRLECSGPGAGSTFVLRLPRAGG